MGAPSITSRKLASSPARSTEGRADSAGVQPMAVCSAVVPSEHKRKPVRLLSPPARAKRKTPITRNIQVKTPVEAHPDATRHSKRIRERVDKRRSSAEPETETPERYVRVYVSVCRLLLRLVFFFLSELS